MRSRTNVVVGTRPHSGNAGLCAGAHELTVMLDLAVGDSDFLFAGHPRPMWVFDGETLEFLAVNDAAVDMYGYARDEFLRRTLAQLWPPDALGELATLKAELRASPHARLIGTYRHCRADGSLFAAHIESAAIVFGGRAARLAMIVDLTQSVSAQRTLHERESQLRRLVDQLPAIMWTTDAELRFTSIAGAAFNRMGLDGAAGVGRRVEELFVESAPGAPSRLPSAHIAALLGERVRYDGWWRGRYFDSVVEPLYGDDRQIVGVIGLSLDVTERYQNRRELERRTDELNTAQAIAHFGSWSMDVLTGEVHWSQELYRIVGESPDDAHVDRTLSHYDHPDDVDAVRKAIEAAELTRTPYDVEHRLVRRDGTVRIVREQGAFDFDRAGRPIRCVGTVLDITERKNAEDRLAYLAHHDTLTDLPNRAMLQDRLRRAVIRAARRRTIAAVLFLDLDRFKYVNDTFGHVVGDELLVHVAQRLAAVLRAGDTVARPGGDEFVIVLEELDDAERASELAQRIRGAFARPFDLTVGPQFIAASIGIALYPHDGRSIDDLMRAADVAMYRAKERGGNDFQFFTPQLHEAATKQLELGNALRAAIGRGDIGVLYQPIVETRGERIVGVEALARWNRLDAAPIGPSEFVKIAEDIGIIRELGEGVMRQACTQMAAWMRAGLPLESISVNVSPRQLGERGFVSRVAEILVAAQLAPHRLELEITETGFVDGNEETFAAIEQLRQLGVRFAIDDFGTGYSSLAYLKRIPADTIKIDRSFIVDVHNPTDRAIVEAVVAVTRNLGKRVVAEGVETADQLAVLRAFGCECAQGFFFGKPVDAAGIEELLRVRR